MGGIFGIFILRAKLNISETQSQITRENPFSLILLFKNFRRSFLCVIGIAALMNVPYYMLVGFLNSYSSVLHIFDKSTLASVNAAITFLLAIGLVGLGSFTKRINPKKIMLLASFLIFLYAIPFFFLIEQGTFIAFLISQVIFLCLNIMFIAPAFSYMTQFFPAEIRYRGIAIGICVGQALFAGITPYVSVFLMKQTGLFYAPGFYVMFISLLGFLSIYFAKPIIK